MSMSKGTNDKDISDLEREFEEEIRNIAQEIVNGKSKEHFDELMKSIDKLIQQRIKEEIKLILVQIINTLVNIKFK